MKRFFLGILSLFIISTSVFAQSSISEARYVSIGSIEQWITINGSDKSKPVILFLHGGPGSVMSPYNKMYDDWSKDFILVNWDQRGAGRTYGRNKPSEVNEEFWIENPLTVEQMTLDGIELSEMLIKYLGKEKIILIGTSWGSVLGTKMALMRPELFYAYIGHSQVVNFDQSIKQAYQIVYQLAKKNNDQESVELLDMMGVPPYNDAKTTGQLLRLIKKYERLNSIAAPDSMFKISPDYDNEIDEMNRNDGDDYSFIHFVGYNKLGIKAMSASINFADDEFEFKIPVYFIQGKEDILTSPGITKSYFDKVVAPSKEFVLLPGAAHGHNHLVIDAQYKMLVEHIIPLIK